MLIFPIHELMDEQKSYAYLLQVLHPDGLKCPQGHPLPANQQPHDRHRAPIMDYRCRACGAVFNLFTDTIWSGSRYNCVQTVLILRGIAQGVPTEHLAHELGIDRSQLLERRHEIQQLIEQGLSPLTPTRRRHRGR
jgi:transposase-like protein